MINFSIAILLWLLFCFIIPNLDSRNNQTSRGGCINVPPASFEAPPKPKPQNRPPSQHKKIQVSEDNIKKLCCDECRCCKNK